MHKAIFPFIAFFLFGVVGCGIHTKPVNHIYDDLSAKKICTIAVLPFINETSYDNGEIPVLRAFTAELINFDNYYVMQEGDVHKVMQQLEVYPGQLPSHEKIQILGNRLNADLLIQGNVISMSYGEGRDNYPLLAVSLKVLDGKTGLTLMTTYHKQKGDQYRKVMHFGLVNTVNALAQRMSQEILNSWFEKGLKRCTES